MRLLILLMCLVSLFFAGLVSAQSQETMVGSAQPSASAEGKSKSAVADEPGAHYLRAMALYKEGPGKATEIIAELDLELQDNPGNEKALLAKAMTQMGTLQLDAALATLDVLSEVQSKAGTISPRTVLIRARCLFYKGDNAAAKQLLDAHWAFFQSDDDPFAKSQYEKLLNELAANSLEK